MEIKSNGPKWPTNISALEGLKMITLVLGEDGSMLGLPYRPEQL